MAELITVFDRPVVMTVKETRDPMEIREMCVAHDWYNAGTVKDYSNMFDMVEHMMPTPSNIMRVAQNIINHTKAEDSYLETVMFHIANEVVMRCFKF